MLQPGASADQLSSAQAKATQLETQIQTTGRQIDSLDQQYLSAQAQKASLDVQIGQTQTKIAADKHEVGTDRSHLKAIALQAYLTDGSSTQNPLFSGSQTDMQASKVYSKVAQGDLSTAMATLQTARSQLDAQESNLHSQDQQAAQAVSTADQAFQQAHTLQSQQQANLSQVKGQIATLIQQQQQAQQQQAEHAAEVRLASLAQHAIQATPASIQMSSNGSSIGSATASAPAPSGSGGGAAVAAAETQLGVPYVWGGESPGRGFDCSGLVAWAWGQAGVSLPHYSGAQMSDSAPVSVSALQPGDLLFYGSGGGTHVAMYVGGGQMIEAPYTGATVRITAVRLGSGFAGAGRP